MQHREHNEVSEPVWSSTEERRMARKSRTDYIIRAEGLFYVKRKRKPNRKPRKRRMRKYERRQERGEKVQ